jgi:hypothetical protein
MEFNDVTGTPRPTRDIEAALRCIESEMIKNPMAMSKTGEPLLIHYTVIRDVLIEVLSKRPE